MVKSSPSLRPLQSRGGSGVPRRPQKTQVLKDLSVSTLVIALVSVLQNEFVNKSSAESRRWHVLGRMCTSKGALITHISSFRHILGLPKITNVSVQTDLGSQMFLGQTQWPAEQPVCRLPLAPWNFSLLFLRIAPQGGQQDPHPLNFSEIALQLHLDFIKQELTELPNASQHSMLLHL